MSNPSAPALPSAPKRGKKGIIIGIIIAVIVVIGIIATVAITSSTSKKTVTIGVTDLSEPYWKTFTKLADDEGIQVKLTNFTDYTKPNPAVAQGQLDLNQFQHLLYLADYNVKNKQDLQPIASTGIYPLPLYSKKYKSVAELPANSTVVVPNDATNGPRALLVLQSAGLIQLKNGGTPFSTAQDITSSKVKVVPIAPNQTAQNLNNGSAAAAVVNNNFAASAGLTRNLVIAKDDPASSVSAAYVNILVTTNKEKNNPTYVKLAKIFQSKTLVAAWQKSYPDGVKVNKTPAQLQSELLTVQKQVQAAE